MATKTAETVTFFTRFPELRLIRIPEDTYRDDRGRVLRQINQRTEAQRIEEQNRERELRDLPPLPIDETPWSITFGLNQIFETDDPALIEWLRGHDGFNRDFWEQGAAPDEPKPTATEQSERIARASALHDEADLHELLDEERAGHNRFPIIRAAESALEAISQIAPEPEAKAERQPSTSKRSKTG